MKDSWREATARTIILTNFCLRHRDAGFEPRPTTSQRDYDDDFDEYFRKRRLRMQGKGVDTKGSNVAYQRSLLQARRRYEGRNRRAGGDRGDDGNVFVVGGGAGDCESEDDSEEEEDVSDTEFFAEYVVEQIEEGLPSWFFEDLLEKFGAGPGRKPKRKGEEEEDEMVMKIEFRDSNYNSMEDFQVSEERRTGERAKRRPYTTTAE